MRAAVYRRFGAPEVVQVEDVAIPTPGPDEVLIRVHASTVSAADHRTRSGEIVRELFEENEDLSNTLTAHVITDSLGRHKDVRNEVAGRKEPIFLLRVPKQEEITNEEDDFTFSDDYSDFLNDF